MKALSTMGATMHLRVLVRSFGDFYKVHVQHQISVNRELPFKFANGSWFKRFPDTRCCLSMIFGHVTNCNGLIVIGEKGKNVMALSCDLFCKKCRP